ncbi:hypothetical protein HMF8227_00849 [Saliniradius amylolyticus]|uniref:HTH cro/C1-type domain-containing protein n=1 Tax=Saliniradius amylolyticus TaxID=2183582 RepID=A0A2S2E127_9ALTE|nr:DUF3612 domain-containing protein [Saliniradius amylolyticus]AWL11344.1 hypothetical protein HMF8227_00849 [Saliniradius amylolyticus]
MTSRKSLIRQSHFLGTKLRNLRKRHGLTIEDLSARCIRIDPEYAPSVSYLSMIERGKRVPSEAMLEVISEVFQKPLLWFLDDEPAPEATTPAKGNSGGISGMPLEPGFLFSQDILQIAIPELLSQTGVSGQQFAHLLIRAYQEHHQNHFPDLERAAEDIGQRRMPLSTQDLLELIAQQGYKVDWFDEPAQPKMDNTGITTHQLRSSYMKGANTLMLNRHLKQAPTRLKYELATYIGRRVLHRSEYNEQSMTIGGSQNWQQRQSHSHIEAADVLAAWRDFECSFFAGALLCPKAPFRQLLDRYGYSIDIHRQIEVSPAVAMRRMTAVSSYPHWHYFDAYSPGKLKAVYRGNGIPLPWGNMRTVDDPCQHWAVFRKLSESNANSSAQISVLHVNGQPRIYCCDSVRVQDLANNPHVLCAGIDLNPALEAQGHNANELAELVKQNCSENGGSALLPSALRQPLTSVAKILNIGWIEQGMASPAHLICAKGSECPRNPSCYG